MKHYLLTSFACLVICGSAFAGSAEKSSQHVQIINICHVTDHDLNEMMLGHCPETIVEFSAQTTLSISLFLKGDLINFMGKEPAGTLQIQQTFYARCIERELFLSADLLEWKPLLEFITGSISVTLDIQEGGPSVIMGAEATIR